MFPMPTETKKDSDTGAHPANQVDAPEILYTPVKGSYNSPGQSFTCHKDEDGCIVSEDPDARFSSNTTQKYITKTSGGSMIHTNFKINQNSL